MWSEIAFIAPLIFNLLIVILNRHGCKLQQHFQNMTFPKPVSLAFLLGLGFDSHDNAPGFNDVF